MNEELLQLAYSKFKTDATYEQFKADFGKDEGLRKLAHSKLKTKATYNQFLKDIGYGEPKKANAVSSESPSDSAVSPSTSDTSEGKMETQEPVSLSECTEPIKPDANLEIADLYDQYKKRVK